MTPVTHEQLTAYADLTLRLGLDFKAGQRLLVLNADITAAPFFTQLARAAYALGASRVDVLWRDEVELRERVANAPLHVLDQTPPHERAALDSVTSDDAVLRVLSGDPRLLDGLDSERALRYQQGFIAGRTDFLRRLSSFEFVWSGIGVPTLAWARAVFPDLDEDAALRELWRNVLSTVRLDQPDPVLAWHEHLTTLRTRREHLNARRYDALHFRGPGTDLRVGLTDGHVWTAVGAGLPNGRRPLPNMPSEEVFTAPHRDRVEGVVSATRTLNLHGTLVEGLRVRFEGGRVVDVSATTNEDAARQLLATDEGAARLGEVALVPNSSPLSQTGLLYHNILFDENAASHLAFGNAYPITVNGDPSAFDVSGGNRSSVHMDFMVGSGEVDVDGVLPDGRVEPLMRGGEWVTSLQDNSD